MLVSPTSGGRFPHFFHCLLVNLYNSLQPCFLRLSFGWPFVYKLVSCLTHNHIHTQTHTHTHTHTQALMPTCIELSLYTTINNVPHFLQGYPLNMITSIVFQHYSMYSTIITCKSCLWCNGYHRRKWTQQLEFKSWTRMIAFHIALIPLGKVLIQLFSLQLWVNSRTDWVLQPWWGNLSRRRKTLNSNLLNST